MQLTVVSSGSQLLLSNKFFVSFWVQEWVCFRNLLSRTFKEKMLPRVILHNNSFTQHLFNPRLWMENHWWNVRVFIKKQFTKPFFEEIFRPANSKSLRLRSAIFEIQLRHGVWGPPFKQPLLSLLKQFLVCSERARKGSFTPPRIFSSQRKFFLPFPIKPPSKKFLEPPTSIPPLPPLPPSAKLLKSVARGVRNYDISDFYVLATNALD